MKAAPGECRLCGHQCRADRTQGHLGRCQAGTAAGVAQALLHHGEEPPLSGVYPAGSGTIFFTRCCLACVFCQNWQISQAPGAGREVAAEELADIMLSLAEAGALNINLVSPTPYVPVIARALVRAKKQGLALPVVYNTGGYDSLRALAIMEGLADIYLPDAKIGRDPLLAEGDPDSRSMRLLGAGDYTAVNRLALKEMLRQTGHLVLDQDGIARKGLLVRHLVLPDDLARTSELLPWLAENLGRQVCLSLMAQYHPNNRLRQGGDPELRAFPGLTRPLSIREYELAAEQAWNLGLENTFVQDPSSSGTYIPDFSRPKVFS